MLPAYLINLDRRPDRLEACTRALRPLEGLIALTRVAAVEGRSLEIDETLRARINPWNLTEIPEAHMRSIVGCTLSHLQAWQTLLHTDAPWALVMEDDARPIKPQRLAADFSRVLKKLPADADLVWLNDWDRPHAPGRGAALALRLRKLRARLQAATGTIVIQKWIPRIEMTSEACLVSREGAKKLCAALGNDLGAVDHHIMLHAQREPKFRAFQCRPALFTQADRGDTNIQESRTEPTG